MLCHPCVTSTVDKITINSIPVCWWSYVPRFLYQCQLLLIQSRPGTDECRLPVCGFQLFHGIGLGHGVSGLYPIPPSPLSLPCPRSAPLLSRFPYPICLQIFFKGDAASPL